MIRGLFRFARNDGVLIGVIYPSRELLRTYLVICSDGFEGQQCPSLQKDDGCTSPGRRVYIGEMTPSLRGGKAGKAISPSMCYAKKHLQLGFIVKSMKFILSFSFNIRM